MVLGFEATRRQVAEITRAAVNFIDPIALPAVEMMVVMQVGDLIASLATGHVDSGEFFFLQESLDRTVNCGDAQTGDLITGGFKDFSWRQRSFGGGDCSADRIALTGITFDGHARQV